ncbi:MAG TPA: sterol desaturase family protein [Flavisolibacter sp.]|nr:sterol desaturase family protein [Flavisolibacter sp.]
MQDILPLYSIHNIHFLQSNRKKENGEVNLDERFPMPPVLLLYAIPGFVLLLGLEAWFSYKENKHLYEVKDTFSSLCLGIGNVMIGLVTKTLIFGFFLFLYQFRLFNLDDNKWWYWIFLFVADDLSYYGFHRTAHNMNWFWASHVVHHSSQKYNLAAALRQTWTGNLTGSFLFWTWLPLLGFHPLWVMFMQQVSLIYQFWIHTETIHRLPAPIEFLFNTPSHHRVHHGSDIKYLDKNHGGILIIWYRLFGTFKKEEERPTYGLTKNIETYNPVVIAFSTWKSLIQQAARSGSVKNAVHYFLNQPGWSHDGSSKTVKQMRAEEKEVKLE